MYIPSPTALPVPPAALASSTLSTYIPWSTALPVPAAARASSTLSTYIPWYKALKSPLLRSAAARCPRTFPRPQHSPSPLRRSPAASIHVHPLVHNIPRHVCCARQQQAIHVQSLARKAPRCNSARYLFVFRRIALTTEAVIHTHLYILIRSPTRGKQNLDISSIEIYTHATVYEYQSYIHVHAHGREDCRHATGGARNPAWARPSASHRTR